jgi:hypothetical protein
MTVEMDDEIEAMARRHGRINAGVLAAFYLLPVAIVYYALSGGPINSVVGVVALVAWVASVLPLFRVRTRERFVTDRSPGAVVEQYGNTVHPLTALTAGQADRIAAAGNGAGPTVFEGTMAGLVSWERRIETTREDDAVRVRVGDGDEVTAVVDVAVGEEGETTWVDVEADRASVSALALLTEWVGSGVERRVHDHFGYRLVNRSTGVGLRGG